MELHRMWTAIAMTGALLIGGCSSAAAVQVEMISEQGGFRDAALRLAEADEEAYCGAEVLRWRYDERSATLRIADARLMLDCCGKRAIAVEKVDDVIEVTERDEPDLAHGRCEDQCAFDFSVGVRQVPRGEIYVKLLRDVVDRQGSPLAVWSGALDLAEASGAILIDSTPAHAGCQDRDAVRRRNGTVAVR